MVQLSLLECEARSLHKHVRQLADRWARRGAVKAHVDEAMRATAAHFASWRSRGLSETERERVAAYFGGVMRRRLLRGTDAESIAVRRRLVAASVETDLRAAGWRAESAAAEARRVAGIDGSLGGAA